MEDALSTVHGIVILIFVVTSMFGMGLSLTWPEIKKPLKNKSLVVKALLANFILVPIIGIAMAKLIPIDEAMSTGLIIIAVVAGAPFIPKLVQIAKADVAFGVGFMFLVMIVTIFYAPIMIPLVIEGAGISAIEIGKSLIVLMLIPLVIGLFIKARYQAAADWLRGPMNQTSTISLIVLLFLTVVIYYDLMWQLIGSGAFLVLLLFVFLCFIIGYFLGGSKKNIKQVMAIGTTQRNLAAAVLIAAQNFDDPSVITFIIAAAIVMIASLMIVSGEFARRKKKK